MSLKLRKLSYALGAEVCDIDVSVPMSEAAFGEIYQAFLDHGILLFRNQDITREQQHKLNPPMAQPVVRVHPETGKKALYLGEKVKRFDGMTEDESQPLIRYLNAHATRPEFVYRQQGRKDAKETQRRAFLCGSSLRLCG